MAPSTRTTSPCSVDLAKVIEAIVDARVERKLAALGLIHAAAVYTSDDLPPDCKSSRIFAFVCRSGRVAGAERIGRQWRCTREAWIAARRRPAKARLSLVPQADSVDDLVAVAMAGVRGRPTR